MGTDYNWNYGTLELIGTILINKKTYRNYRVLNTISLPLKNKFLIETVNITIKENLTLGIILKS